MSHGPDRPTTAPSRCSAATHHEDPPDGKLSADHLRWFEARDVAAIAATALREGWLVGDR